MLQGDDNFFIQLTVSEISMLESINRTLGHSFASDGIRNAWDVRYPQQFMPLHLLFLTYDR